MDTINDKNHQIIPTTEPQKPAKKGIQLGIKRIRALLTALGKPHETFKAIHLSGTVIIKIFPFLIHTFRMEREARH